MTRKQRNEVYRLMLEEITSHPSYSNYGVYYSGLCYALSKVARDLNYTVKTNIYYYPELIVQKPFDAGVVYWFPIHTTEGADERICILLSAYMETL